MATLPTLEQDNDAPLAAEGLMLSDILSGQNLAEMLTEAELNKIGQDVIRDVRIDEKSRGEWKTRNDEAIDVAMQVAKKKSFPWPKASNVKNPILTIASIQFNAEAYPVIVDGSNLVKGRVLGPDPDGQKRARADRIGQHMTWQLMYRMPGWEDETDRLLLMLPITGCVFRKTWYDAIENANRSEVIAAQDFIINNDAKSIDTAPRYAHVLHYYPYEVHELTAAGQWVKVPVEPDDKGDDEQALVDFYEQHRCIDLDQDGYPEHYVVTCTKEGKVSRIVPCFGPEDITVAVLSQDGRHSGQNVKLSKLMDGLHPDDPRWQMVGDIVKISRRQYFTKYGFIPSPDGSFYDVGFGFLLENTSEAINSLMNQMIDAASLQNAQGGFVGSGVNVRGGNMRFALGEWKRVDVMGGDLRANIVPLTLPGPSAVSFNLLELLLSQAKDITSSQDVVAGRGAPNQPATTTLALIEQAGTVKKGIFKRIYRAFGQELRILRRLNRDYLDEEEYFNLNDPQPELGQDGQPAMGADGQPQMTTVAKVGREDYADDDLDVVPVADPTQISDTHKVARAEARFQLFNGDPLINQKLIREDMLLATGASDLKRYFDVPQPAPDPKIMLEMGKQMLAKQEAGTQHMKDSATSADSLADAASKLAEIGLTGDAASLAAAAVHIGGEAEPHEVLNEHPEQPGGVPEMEGQAGDGGVLQPPPDPAAAPDGGMGAGGGDAGGIAGAGSPAGPVGAPPV